MGINTGDSPPVFSEFVREWVSGHKSRSVVWRVKFCHLDDDDPESPVGKRVTVVAAGEAGTSDTAAVATGPTAGDLIDRVVRNWCEINSSSVSPNN